MVSTDEIIRAIVADATPVQRLAPPLLRALAWFGFAVVVVALMALSFGMRADLSMRLENSAFTLELVAIAATGATATVAAFYVSIPDRSSAWLLRPVPAALL